MLFLTANPAQRFGLIILLTVALNLLSCRTSAPEIAVRSDNLPLKVLWAWERPEDLRFLNTNEFGAAFLAQTLILQGDDVVVRPRRQPLEVSPDAKLIAVTRVESHSTATNESTLSDRQKSQIIALVLKTLTLKNVLAIQIDYDVRVSEREFYRELLIELRERLPADVALSITALASFCIGDRWFGDLPIDEAIPMIFRMGLDDAKVKGFLTGGNDFPEPLCRKSYGVATDEPITAKLDPARRLYVFNVRSWTERDVNSISRDILR